MATGILIIYASPNGRDAWQPVAPELVPEWLKDGDTLGRLVVAGEMACKADEGESGSLWYRAAKIEPEAMAA